MEMERLLGRAERLRQIELLLFKTANGMTARELAQRCGVHRSTIYRDIESLSATEVPVWQEGGRVGLLRDRYLATVRLHLHEALALFLAARLLGTLSGKRNPHMVSALDKLAAVLPEPLAEHIAHTAEWMRHRGDNPHYVKVLETLTRAWADGRRAWMRYMAYGKQEATERLFDVYFMEPSAVGHACHVIGYDHHRKGVRIFKVERVERIELTDDIYEIPHSFDPYRFLSTAWGIMGGDETAEVRLRFSPKVTRRVKESVWHPSQLIEELPDGGCVWSAQVSHTTEMRPWIRGWGANCEVLAPEELRREIAEEVDRMAELYRTTPKISRREC